MKKKKKFESVTHIAKETQLWLQITTSYMDCQFMKPISYAYMRVEQCWVQASHVLKHREDTITIGTSFIH